jgi:hypothetical protein
MLLDVNTSAQPTEVKGGDSSMSVLAKVLRELTLEYGEELRWRGWRC